MASAAHATVSAGVISILIFLQFVLENGAISA
jgi:hypothetical protein